MQLLDLDLAEIDHRVVAPDFQSDVAFLESTDCLAEVNRRDAVDLADQVIPVGNDLQFEPLVRLDYGVAPLGCPELVLWIQEGNRTRVCTGAFRKIDDVSGRVSRFASRSGKIGTGPEAHAAVGALIDGRFH